MIIRLDEHLRNQIAAGEVVERPASIVKELMENSLDAHSTDINVFFSKHNVSFEIQDNGDGIPNDELSLALERHTTSKIKNAGDLQSIRSLGFRGEALASIAAVSELTIASKSPHDANGRKITVEFGNIVKDEPDPIHRGTRIRISRIFEQLPARQKFLKTLSTELKSMRQEFLLLALAWPEVSFTMYEDTAVVLSCPAVDTLEDRITQIYADLKGELLPIYTEGLDFSISGLVAKPSKTYKRPARCHFFVNNRPIESPVILKALKDAYYTVIPDNTYPAAFIHLQLDPLLVDVNVHPRKKEVRFSNPSDLFVLVKKSAEQTLKDGDLLKHIELRPNQSFHIPQEYAQNRVMQFADSPQWTGTQQSNYQQEPARQDVTPSHTRFIGQLRTSYLVFEDEQGLLVVDQHAMHERINYEKLKHNLTDVSPAQQQLLLPIIFTVPVKDAPKFEHIIEVLQKAGFEIEPLSGSSFQIRSIPVVFQKIQFEKVWDDILEDLSEFGTLDSMHKLIDETLHTVACRSSIMFNDFVTPVEALELLKLSEELAIDASCPHGRPTKFRLDYNELEKYFLR